MVKHVKADVILPDTLIQEIQKYIQGQYLYIPAKKELRKKWGEASGTRELIESRNTAIVIKHSIGYSIDALADEFFLSVHSIKKIVYKKR